MFWSKLKFLLTTSCCTWRFVSEITFVSKNGFQNNDCVISAGTTQLDVNKHFKQTKNSFKTHVIVNFDKKDHCGEYSAVLSAKPNKVINIFVLPSKKMLNFSFPHQELPRNFQPITGRFMRRQCDCILTSPAKADIRVSEIVILFKIQSCTWSNPNALSYILQIAQYVQKTSCCKTVVYPFL